MKDTSIFFLPAFLKVFIFSCLVFFFVLNSSNIRNNSLVKYILEINDMEKDMEHLCITDVIEGVEESEMHLAFTHLKKTQKKIITSKVKCFNSQFFLSTFDLEIIIPPPELI